MCRVSEGQFGSLYDTPTKYLSVIVPAYNEEKRMGVMLDEMMGELKNMERSRRFVCLSPHVPTRRCGVSAPVPRPLQGLHVRGDHCERR